MVANNLVVSSEGYDDDSMRRASNYQITLKGQLALDFVDDYSVKTIERSKLVADPSLSDSIKELLIRSISLIECQSNRSAEPLRFHKLEFAFHDHPLLKAMFQYDMDIRTTGSTLSSGERLKCLMNKKQDITTVPAIALLNEIREGRKMNEIVILGAIEGDRSAKLVSFADEPSKAYFSDGLARRELAKRFDVDGKPEKVDITDLLKGASSDYSAVVSNVPDPELLKYEYGGKIRERFDEISFLVTHIDCVGNKQANRIYRNYETLFSNVNRKGWLLKRVIEYENTDLSEYLTKYHNIYKQVSRELVRNLPRQVLANES